MDLFERYLQAVKGCLPKGQRDDIIRELSDDLRSQVEDREEELARPLTQPEQVAILKQFGHPMLLAARYRPNRQLIGSALFPFYWFVLKTALLGMVVVNVMASAVLLASGRPAGDVLSSLVTLPVGPGVMVFGWVTLVFAIADPHVTRLPFIADWNPESLPPVKKEPSGPSRLTLVGEIFSTTAFILWWAAIPRYPWLIFGPAWALVELGPAWSTLHVPILLVASAGLIVHWINLVRPDWLALRSIAKVGANLVALVILGLVRNAGDLVVADNASPDEARVVMIVNATLYISLGVAAIVMVFEVVREVVRLVRSHLRAVTSRA